MKSRSALVFEELEPRLLLSADLPVDITAALAPDRGEDETVSVHEEITATAVTVEQYGRRELVLVDTDTPDYQALVDDLLSNSREEHLIEVVLLDNNSDGISQVTDTLSKFRELDAVHIISHGTDGSVDLGDGTLNFDTLKDNTEFIKAWGKAVSTDGDLLIYGCNLAATADGQSLVDALGQLTGADVAASDDLTGSSALGGDWDLEYQTGSIEAQVALSAELQATWQGTLIAPALNTPGPAINYVENDPATVLDPSATVLDVDSEDFHRGTLSVSFSAGGTANDELSIVEGGVVDLVGSSSIKVNGNNVGRFSGGTGGSSLVISWNPQATPADAQAVLRQIGYQNTSDDPSTTQRIIDFVLTDGDGGTSNTAQQAVNVSSVNDVPIATVDSFTVNEGSTTNLNLARNDTDADDGLDLTSITIVAGPANGAIVINADGTVDYTHDGSETVADSFTYNINDASGATSTVGTVNLSINPVNDAPIHNIPTAQNTTGDTPLIFSSLNGNSIMVADPDASGAPVEVTLSVSNGSLTLAGTRGLSFIVGEGRGDAAMTFTGTAADINAALNGLSFQADADYEGIATVQIITDDLGNVGSGGALNAMHRISVAVSASVPSGISQDTLLALDELILEDSFDLLAPEPMAVNNVNVAQAAEEAINAATPDSGSGTTTTSDPAVDAMPGSGRGVPTQADVSLPGLVRVFDQNLQSAADDRPSSVRLIGHEIRQGLMDPFTYAKMLNPLQPDAVIWESIEAMMEQMDDSDSSWYQDDQVLTTTTVTGLTVSFTVGYVSWLLRAGYLSASLLSVLPLWREFDPLPVLATNAKHTGKASGKSAGDDKDSTQTNDIESESIFSSNETS